VTAAPSHASDTATASPLGLRLAAAAAAAHPSSEARTIGWRFPALPPALADAVAKEWGLTIVEDADAIDPRSHGAFAALHAHARSEQEPGTAERATSFVFRIPMHNYRPGDGGDENDYRGRPSRIENPSIFSPVPKAGPPYAHHREQYDDDGSNEHDGFRAFRTTGSTAT
jgi:hypothetical protein